MNECNAIEVEKLTKAYRIWKSPSARLKAPIRQKAAVLFGNKKTQTQGKYYKDFYALHDVSFSIRKGESVGIIGCNGSGKSTLLQIIAGTLQPTGGVVQVAGRVAALLELGSGFNPEFTGRENVYLNASILGLSREETTTKYASIETFAGIGEFINQPVKTYSSGMMMRLAFAVAVHVDADILIVDEALSVGDTRFQKKCFDRMRQFVSDGNTLLFVSHDTGTIVQTCDQAIILNNGKVYDQGDPGKMAKVYHQLLFDSEEEEKKKQQAASTDIEDVEKLDNKELRYGNLDLEIIEVGVSTESDIQTRFVRTGEKTTLYAKVSCNAEWISQADYGFIIKNKTGLELYGTSSKDHNLFLSGLKKGDIVFVEATMNMLLPPGDYFVTTAVAPSDSSDTDAFYDVRMDAMHFEVRGSTTCFFNALVDLRAKLQHRQVT